VASYTLARLALNATLRLPLNQGQSTIKLTNNELQVLLHTSKHKTANECAELMNTSPRTASYYITRACLKLGSNSKPTPLNALANSA
jgi:DNA-binding CsgD family transcriptional regulator